MLHTHSTWVRALVAVLCLLGSAQSAWAKPKAKAAAPQPKAAEVASPEVSAQPDAAAGTQPGAASAQPDVAGEKPAQSGVAEEHAPAPAQVEVVAANGGAAERTPAKAPPKLSAEQLAALRAESSQLIDDMTQARAKASLLGTTLFKTQLRLRVQNLAAPDPRLTKIVVKLDGAPVFVGDGAALSGDDIHKVFEGFIAPGQHVLTAELKQQSRQDSSFGYSLHDTYNFKAQRDKLSELTLIVDDDSDMADDYPDDGDGEYDVRLKLRVRTKNIGED